MKRLLILTCITLILAAGIVAGVTVAAAGPPAAGSPSAIAVIPPCLEPLGMELPACVPFPPFNGCLPGETCPA